MEINRYKTLSMSKIIFKKEKIIININGIKIKKNLFSIYYLKLMYLNFLIKLVIDKNLKIKLIKYKLNFYRIFNFTR